MHEGGEAVIPKYGILEGRFYMEGNKCLVFVEFRNFETGETVTKTIEAEKIKEGMTSEANNFIYGVVEQMEKLGR